jgi:hypothetical protein
MTGLRQRGFPLFRCLLAGLGLMAATACSGTGFSPDTFEVLADTLNDGGRAFHAAVENADGDVFLVGGQNAAGLPMNADQYADRFWWSLRLFVPEQAFTSATGRVAGRAFMAGSDVVSAGGQVSGATAAATAPEYLSLAPPAVPDGDRYDPATTLTGAVALAGGAANAALATDAGGDVFLIGGRDQSNALRSEILRYDPGSSAFVGTGVNLLTAREGAAATLLSSGEILIVGGWDQTGAPLQSAELYHPLASSVIAAPSPLLPRAQATATPSADRTKVLIYGGFKAVNTLAGNTAPTEVAEVYEVGVGFRAVASATAPLPRVYHSATLLDNGDVLIAGGVTDASGTVTDSAQLFRFSTETVRDAAGTLAFPRFGHTATVLRDHTVLLAGGLSAPGSLVPEVERYLPEVL